MPKACLRCHRESNLRERGYVLTRDLDTKVVASWDGTSRGMITETEFAVLGFGSIHVCTSCLKRRVFGPLLLLIPIVFAWSLPTIWVTMLGTDGDLMEPYRVLLRGLGHPDSDVLAFILVFVTGAIPIIFFGVWIVVVKQHLVNKTKEFVRRWLKSDGRSINYAHAEIVLDGFPVGSGRGLRRRKLPRTRAGRGIRSRPRAFAETRRRA